MYQYSTLQNDPFVINVDKGMYTKGRLHLKDIVPSIFHSSIKFGRTG